MKIDRSKAIVINEGFAFLNYKLVRKKERRERGKKKEEKKNEEEQTSEN